MVLRCRYKFKVTKLGTLYKKSNGPRKGSKAKCAGKMWRWTKPDTEGVPAKLKKKMALGKLKRFLVRHVSSQPARAKGPMFPELDKAIEEAFEARGLAKSSSKSSKSSKKTPTKHIRPRVRPPVRKRESLPAKANDPAARKRIMKNMAELPPSMQRLARKHLKIPTALKLPEKGRALTQAEKDKLRKNKHSSGKDKAQKAKGEGKRMEMARKSAAKHTGNWAKKSNKPLAKISKRKGENPLFRKRRQKRASNRALLESAAKAGKKAVVGPGGTVQFVTGRGGRKGRTDWGSVKTQPRKKYAAKPRAKTIRLDML